MRAGVFFGTGMWGRVGMRAMTVEILAARYDIMISVPLRMVEYVCVWY